MSRCRNVLGPATVAMCLLLAASPPALADHGEDAYYLAQALTCTITADAEYDIGSGDEQAWFFTFYTHGCGDTFDSDDCIGFGSIEAGWRSLGCASGRDFHIGGTGGYYACCPDTLAVYLHPLVEVSYAGFTAKGVAFVHN